MRGTIAEGDCLWVCAVSPDELQPGDVVAFRSGGHVMAHRIAGRAGDRFLTQGDGNWRRDSTPLDPVDLIGRVEDREQAGVRSALAGGARGRRRAAVLHVFAFSRWSVLVCLAPFYRLIRASRLASLVWRPRIVAVRFASPAGTITKFIHRGRTVACWNPQAGQWTCRKPYDLLLPPPSR